MLELLYAQARFVHSSADLLGAAQECKAALVAYVDLLEQQIADPQNTATTRLQYIDLLAAIRPQYAAIMQTEVG